MKHRNFSILISLILFFVIGCNGGQEEASIKALEEGTDAIIYDYSYTIDSGSGIVDDGALVQGSFVYRPNEVARDVDQTAFSSGIGEFSFYEHAVVDLSGSVQGEDFFAELTDTKIVDAEEGTENVDGYFIDAGSRTITDKAFIGFTVGDYTLVGASIFGLDESNYLSGQGLPSQLGKTEGNSGIHLYFVNGQGEEFTVFSGVVDLIEPRVALDSDVDFDGVLDAVDQCSQTPIDEAVDDTGCPKSA